MKPFEKGTRESRFKREEFPFHARFAAHQAFKYQWLASLAHGFAGPPPFVEPWLLMDTDTIVQCSATELRERFAALSSPLVIGGEFQWWPKRDRQHDPWKPQPPPGIRYPNSGMVMGTQQGFAALERAFQAMPRYPCCAKFAKGKPTGQCHIDDQHCLQSALMLNDERALPWTLDTNASLFLNLLGINDNDLERRDGRCFYKPTGRAPCVLHSNGKMAKPKMAHVFGCKPDDAWIVPTAKGLRGAAAAANQSLSAAAHAALLFPTTH